MSGSTDWVSDRDIGGPYGYAIIIVQKGGVRLSCDGPVVPASGPEDIYAAAIRAQKRLIARQPATLKDAFAVTENVEPGA